MATPRKPRVQNNEDFESYSEFNTNKPNQNNMKKVVISGILLLVIVVLTLMAFKITTIEGNQLGVKETWANGVEADIMQPKTYFLFPGWSQSVFKYDASSQVFVMNDKVDEDEKAEGRQKDAYLVQSQEGQDMKISLNLRWRIDPTKLVSIHKTVRNNIEEKIIRPVVMRVVKDEATKMKAIDAYSGEGLVQLQSNIQTALAGSGEGKELADRGVIVENFVIEHIELDPAYIAEIKQKQIATQKTLRSVEEQKAADAQALVAKALAQADYNKQVVEAERDAKVRVTAAQAANESAIIAAKAEQQKTLLAAEAEQKKLILEAEGKKQSMIAIAEGTLAQGKAEAEAKRLQLSAWAVPGAEAFTKVEISKNVATAFQNIKGYLPSDMKVNLLTDNFGKSVDILSGNPVLNVTSTSTPTK